MRLASLVSAVRLASLVSALRLAIGDTEAVPSAVQGPLSFQVNKDSKDSLIYEVCKAHSQGVFVAIRYLYSITSALAGPFALEQRLLQYLFHSALAFASCKRNLQSNKTRIFVLGEFSRLQSSIVI